MYSGRYERTLGGVNRGRCTFGGVLHAGCTSSGVILHHNAPSRSTPTKNTHQKYEFTLEVHKKKHPPEVQFSLADLGL